MQKRFLNFKGILGLAAFMAAMFLSIPVQAQLSRGAITGTVHDQTGAVVPGAQVEVNNPNTNIKRDTTTDDSGFYRVAALDPGTYTVVISKAGFSKIENREVTVKPTLDTTFDGDLKVGDIAGTVDVTAETETIALNKTNGTIGLTASPKQAVELPLSAARDVNQLALLSPNAFSAPGSTGISVNGQRARNDNFTIDGSDNNDNSVTLSTTPVIPEDVAEFQVQTNPYSVEFGRNSGAQINVITRGGTNGFHGDLFEYYRGSALNALTNIDKQNGLTRPGRFNRNQTGFTIGGPVMLPRFGEGGHAIGYNGKNKTFFFFSYQEDRSRSGGSPGTAAVIPTPAGFAALATVPLRAAQGGTPAQTAASRAAVLSRISFLNAIYATNPVFTSISTTTVNGVSIQTGKIAFPISQPSNLKNTLLRIDHKISDKDNLTFRFIGNREDDVNLISNLQFGSLFAGNQSVNDNNIALSETHIFNSNILNEFRFSYVRRNLAFPENDSVSPSVTIGGAFSVGGLSNFPQGRIQNDFQYNDTLSDQIGKHSFKFGLDIRKIKLFNLAAFNIKGTFAFDNLQQYLNNFASSFQQALQQSTYDARQTQQSYFAQDDWRVTPNLTINLGLRYELSSVPFGFFGATDPQSLAALVPGPVQEDKNNFAPAFGFAYSPHATTGLAKRLFGDGVTVLRGGYRIAYDQLFFNLLTVDDANFPRVVTGNITNAADVYPSLAPVAGAAVFSPTALYVNTPSNARTPYSELYSFSVQREFRHSYVLEFGYTGSRSINQVNQLEGNPAILTPAQAAAVAAARSVSVIPSAQNRRIFPQFGSRVLIATEAEGTYNAGFVTLNKRFSHGLQFGIAYTYSKNMSNNDESLGVGAITTGSPQIPQDYLNRGVEKSLSAFDRTHRLVANYIYEVPTPGFAKSSGALRRLFGGWEITGVTTRQSGQPFSIVTGVDSNGNGAGGDRPNFDPSGQVVLDPVTHNFRTFTTVGTPFIVPRGTNGLPLASSLGNGSLGRNTYRAPGFYNTNLSIAKRIGLGGEGARKLYLRADFLNAFNQDNYGIPVNSLNSTLFGQNINNFGGRTITLGIKFSF
jgi:outer membrane receptor protein involved in Fe transport